jgi:hypothetical protein
MLPQIVKILKATMACLKILPKHQFRVLKAKKFLRISDGLAVFRKTIFPRKDSEHYSFTIPRFTLRNNIICQLVPDFVSSTDENEELAINIKILVHILYLS